MARAPEQGTAVGGHMYCMAWCGVEESTSAVNAIPYKYRWAAGKTGTMSDLGNLNSKISGGNGAISPKSMEGSVLFTTKE